MNGKTDRDRESDYAWDGEGTPDPFVADMEASLAGLRGRTDAEFHMPRRRVGPALAAAAMIALAVTATLMMRGGVAATWTYDDMGAGVVSTLERGTWIEPSSRSTVSSDDVGTIWVDPGSRLRLVESRPNRQRLELAKGRIDAFVTTPPRLFVVDTPVAQAIDMGCAYTLEVDETGGGLLHVTFGWVELASERFASRVAAGMMCPIRGATGGATSDELTGAGIPYREDAPEAFVAVLGDVERAPRGEALQEVLAMAAAEDACSLWHVLHLVDESDRTAVLSRIGELAGLPSGVSKRDLAELKPRAMDRLWELAGGSKWPG